MFYQVNEKTIINISRINYVQFNGLKTFQNGEKFMHVSIYMIDDTATAYLTEEEVANLKKILGIYGQI
jgi:hypothetical protein